MDKFSVLRNYSFKPQLRRSGQTAVEISALMSNHTLLLYVDVITYLWPNLNADLAKLWRQKNPPGGHCSTAIELCLTSIF